MCIRDRAKKSPWVCLLSPRPLWETRSVIFTVMKGLIPTMVLSEEAVLPSMKWLMASLPLSSVGGSRHHRISLNLTATLTPVRRSIQWVGSRFCLLVRVAGVLAYMQVQSRQELYSCRWVGCPVLCGPYSNKFTVASWSHMTAVIDIGGGGGCCCVFFVPLVFIE